MALYYMLFIPLLHGFGIEAAMAQIQFTSQYNGQNVTGLFNLSFTFNWIFSGNVKQIQWGVWDVQTNTGLRIILVDIISQGILSYQLPSSSPYYGRIAGSFKSNISSGQVIITLRNIRQDDKAVYGCILFPQNLDQTSKFDTVNFVVKDAASIEKVTPFTSQSWIGEKITLTCEANGVPKPDITWIKPDGTEIKKVGATEHKANVLMKTDQDFGIYTCKASNDVGTAATKTVEVQQIKAPGSPIVTVNIQATSITVSWTKPADNGGSPITAYRVIILQGNNEIKNYITYLSTMQKYIGGLTKSTNYTVRVSARNYVFEGNASERKIWTKFEGAPTAAEIIDLPAVTNETEITLKWKEAENNGAPITKYTVYQRIARDNGTSLEWIKIRDIKDYQTTVKLEKGKDYEFVVTATNKFGEAVRKEGKIKIIKVLGVSSTEKPTESQTAVNVTCGKNEMSISIPKYLLPRIDREHLRLIDVNCGAIETKTHYILSTHLTKCFTFSRHTKNFVFYMNKVEEIPIAKHQIITRVQKVEIPFSCYYSNMGVVSAIGLKVKNKKIVFTKTGYGKLELEMKIFPTPRYRLVYKANDFPIVVAPRKILYVQVHVDSDDRRLSVLAVDCWATPSSDPLSKGLIYVFIRDGCAIDDTVKFIPTGDNRTQHFSTEAFSFVGEHQFVYMHCKVKACNATDHSSRCAQGCIRRGKRSMMTYQSKDEEVNLSQGPFMRGEGEEIKQEETERDLRNVDKSGVYPTLVTAMAVVTVVCIMGVSYFAWDKRKREAVRDYQRLSVAAEDYQPETE